MIIKLDMNTSNLYEISFGEYLTMIDFSFVNKKLGQEYKLLMTKNSYCDHEFEV